MKIYAKSRTGNYNATAIYQKSSITILKGSIISPKESKSIPKSAHEKRANKNLVSSEYLVLKDIKFKSASSASNFVTGNSTNGLLIWKNSSGETLKSLKK